MAKIYLQKRPAHEWPHVCHDKDMNGCYFGKLVDGQSSCKPMDKKMEKYKCYDPGIVFIQMESREQLCLVCGYELQVNGECMNPFCGQIRTNEQRFGRCPECGCIMYPDEFLESELKSANQIIRNKEDVISSLRLAVKELEDSFEDDDCPGDGIHL